MFIRPVNVTVTAATRRPGHPLLRGLLRRAAGAAEWGQDVDTAGATGEEALAEAFVEDEDEALAEAAGMEGMEAAGMEGMGAAGMEGMEGRAEAADEADAMARPAPWPTTARRGSGTAPAAHGSLVSELTQLAALAQEGLLTPEEFTRAKRRLLEG